MTGAEVGVVRDALTLDCSINCRGNLSIRSLAEVVSAEDFAGTNNSEYLETVLVAVPK